MKSYCELARKKVDVPGELDLYIAGFPCKDFSFLNRDRPCFSGPNAKVFFGVVNYIKEKLPAVYILENVTGLLSKQRGQEAPIVRVMKTLEDIAPYEVKYWKVNSDKLYLP